MQNKSWAVYIIIYKQKCHIADDWYSLSKEVDPMTLFRWLFSYNNISYVFNTHGHRSIQFSIIKLKLLYKNKSHFEWIKIEKKEKFSFILNTTPTPLS